MSATKSEMLVHQVDDELAGTAMDHLLGEVSQRRAVGGRTVSLHSNPTMRSAQLTNISDSGFIVSRGPLLQPQGKQHFCFLGQVSDDLPNGSGRQPCKHRPG